MVRQCCVWIVPKNTGDGKGRVCFTEGALPLVETFVAPKFDMDLEMVWEADGRPGRLQAIECSALPAYHGIGLVPRETEFRTPG